MCSEWRITAIVGLHDPTELRSRLRMRWAARIVSNWANFFILIFFSLKLNRKTDHEQIESESLASALNIVRLQHCSLLLVYYCNTASMLWTAMLIPTRMSSSIRRALDGVLLGAICIVQPEESKTKNCRSPVTVATRSCRGRVWIGSLAARPANTWRAFSLWLFHAQTPRRDTYSIIISCLVWT